MKKVKLGEVVTLKKGKKATILNEQTILSQRYIQIDDLRNDNNLKFTESLNMTEALLDDVLIAWDGANAGTIGYGLSGAVGSTIMVLKKNEQYKDEIISEYLGVFLESKSQYLRYHSTGATIPHLNKNILLDLKLELLRIEEQENIICILNIIKKLITKRKCQLEELNLLVKSRFNEMFGDLLLNEFKWDYASFNEFAKFDTKMISDFSNFIDLPHIGIDSIEKNTGKLIGYRTVGEDQISSGKYLFTKKHIIYSKIRPNLNKVALPDFMGVCSADAYPILTVDEKMNRIFLAHVLRSDYFLNFILSFSSRTNLPKVNKSQISKFVCPLPPLSLQNEFADFVAQVDKSQLAIQKSLEELETLKKSLMQEYFG